MAQLAQGLGFDLADAFAGDLERLANFLQRVLAAISQAKAHLDDFLLARRAEFAAPVRVWSFRLTLITASAVKLTARSSMKSPRCESSSLSPIGGLHGDRLLRDLQHLNALGHRTCPCVGDLFRRRLAAQFLHELLLGAPQLVDGLDHVHRDANRARLVGNGSA